MMEESESAVLEVSITSNADSTNGSRESSIIGHQTTPPRQAQSQGEDEETMDELIMEPGADIVVKVDDPVKKLSTLETYVAFRVRCRCSRWPTPPAVRRRYNHFKAFRQRLVAAHPLLPVPPLPQTHSPRQQLDRYGAEFVILRTAALNTFLDRVAKHTILSHSDDLRVFLTETDTETMEKHLKSDGNSTLNGLWGLTSMIYGIGTGEQNSGATSRVKDPEFSAVTEYLSSLQQKLKTLDSVAMRANKESIGLAKEMIRMKPVLDAWSASEGGALARSLQGLGGAGAAAGTARGAAGVNVHATLAMLQEYQLYIDVVKEKIAERDVAHAAYASNTSSDSLQNRLECASEALRSELTNWNRQKRADLKTLLQQMAQKQVWLHLQNLRIWEETLATCTGKKNENFLGENVEAKKIVNNILSENLSDLSNAGKNEASSLIDDLDVNFDSSKMTDRSESGNCSLNFMEESSLDNQKVE